MEFPKLQTLQQFLWNLAHSRILLQCLYISKFLAVQSRCMFYLPGNWSTHLFLFVCLLSFCFSLQLQALYYYKWVDLCERVISWRAGIHFRGPSTGVDWSPGTKVVWALWAKWDMPTGFHRILWFGVPEIIESPHTHKIKNNFAIFIVS